MTDIKWHRGDEEPKTTGTYALCVCGKDWRLGVWFSRTKWMIPGVPQDRTKVDWWTPLEEIEDALLEQFPEAEDYWC